MYLVTRGKETQPLYWFGSDATALAQGEEAARHTSAGSYVQVWLDRQCLATFPGKREDAATVAEVAVGAACVGAL